jgi:hypothetical protein
VEYRSPETINFDFPMALYELWRNPDERLPFDPRELRQPAGMVRHAMIEWLEGHPGFRDYYGDEFVALVQEVVGAQVEELCARIEGAVSKFSLGVGKNRVARVGISVGTATFGSDGETLDQLVIAADNRMYRMKSTHRSERGAAPDLPESSSRSKISQVNL